VIGRIHAAELRIGEEIASGGEADRRASSGGVQHTFQKNPSRAAQNWGLRTIQRLRESKGLSFKTQKKMGVKSCTLESKQARRLKIAVIFRARGSGFQRSSRVRNEPHVEGVDLGRREGVADGQYNKGNSAGN